MSFMSLRFGLINLFIVGAVAFAAAQMIQYDRFELLLDERPGQENPGVSNLGEEGVMIYRRLGSRLSDQLEVIKLDTALVQQWRGVINLEKSMRVAVTRSFLDQVYFLLRSASYGNFDFLVIVINVQNGKFTTLQLKNLIPFPPSEFLITDQAMLIGGYFNFRPVVLHFSFTSGRSRLLPGFFNEQGELNQLSANPDGSIDVIISSRNYQKKKVLWLRNYSAEGDLLRTVVMEPDADKNFVFAKSYHRPDDTQLVAGVYGARHPEFSRGFFTSIVHPAGDYTVQYYSFSDLENFFKYKKPKREKRVVDRLARRKAKDKKVRLSYRMLVHQFIPYKDGYILLAEAFYPRYIYPNPYGYYGMGLSGTVVRGERIFDGYRYTHAVVLGLDEEGLIRWDNAFEINDVKTFNLDQFVKLEPRETNIRMLYLFENTVRTKTINYNQTVDAKSLTPLRTRFANDVVRDRATESSTLDYWYNHVFVGHGIQYVRNSRYGRDQERKVLFINKLKFQ
jgi:hypothetical protein